MAGHRVFKAGSQSVERMMRYRFCSGFREGTETKMQENTDKHF